MKPFLLVLPARACRPALCRAPGRWLLFVLVLLAHATQAQMFEEALADVGARNTMKYSTTKNKATNEPTGTITPVTSPAPVRAGTHSFKHIIKAVGTKRAELDDESYYSRSQAGEFWYGYSYFLPTAFFDSQGPKFLYQYLGQFRYSNRSEINPPKPNCATRLCSNGNTVGGSGHHLLVNAKHRWEYTVQHQGSGCYSCEGIDTVKLDLGPYVTNAWTDIVINAKWSPEEDGFIRIWMQVAGKGYKLVGNYQGRTWFKTYAANTYQGNKINPEVRAPNFTVGLYANSDNKYREAYTDQIRYYKQEANVDGFARVSPDGASAPSLPVAADAHVFENSSTANYGDELLLITKKGDTHNRLSYLKFDISTLSSTASSVKLRLFGGIAGPTSTMVPCAVYAVPDTRWTESGITWATRKPSVGSSLGTVSVTNSTRKWYTWDVTAYVRQAKAEKRNTISFVLKNTAPSANYITWNSQEASSNKPALVVGHTPVLSMSSQSAQARTDLDQIAPTIPPVQLFPVPAAGELTVQFTAQTSEPVKLTLLTAGGAPVLSRLEPVHKGENQVKLITAGLESGNYILRLVIDGKPLSRQLTIIK